MDRQEGLPPFDVEETVWCEGCRKLKKEVTRLQEEHAINYQTLKQKIISTDLLIRKYRTKCEEFDVQSKRLEDMSKKLDRSQLDCEMLETQLKASLQSTEPLKQTRVDLEAKLKVKDREILNLKNSLEGAEMMRKQFEALIASNDILSSEEDKKQREKRMQTLESSNSRYANQVKSAKDELKSLKSDLSKSSKRGRDVEIKLSKSLTKLVKYWKLLKDNDLLPKGERKPNKAKILDESVWETSQEEFEDTGSLIDEVGHHLEAEPSDDDDDNNNEANDDNVVDDDGGFMDDDVGFMDDGAEDDDDPDEDDYPSIDFRFTFSPICAPVSPLPPSPVPAKQTKTSSFANPSTSIAFDNDDSMDIMAESLQSQLLDDVTTPYTKSVRRSPRLSSGKDRGLFSSADEQDVISKSESFRPKRVKKQKMQENKSEQPGKGADKTAIKPSPRLQSKIDFAGTQAEGYDLETSLPAVSDSSEEEEEVVGGTASFGSRKGSSPFPVHNLIEDMKRLKELAERAKSSDEEEEEGVLLKLRPRNTKEVLQQSCPLADRSGTRSPLSSAKQSCSTDEKENVTENLQNRSMTPKKPLGTLSKSNEHVKCAVSDSDLTDRVTRSMSQPVEEKTKQNGLGARPKSAMAKMEDGFLTPTPPKSKKLRGISPKNETVLRSVETEQSPKKQTRTRTTSLPLDLSDVESSTLRKSPRSRSEALGSTDNLQLKKSLRSQSVETLNVKDTDSPVRVLRSRLRDSLSDSSESQVSSLRRTSSPVKQKKDPFVKKKKASTEELSKLVHGTEVKNPVSNVSEIAKCSSPELKKGHVLAKQQTDNDDVLGMKSSSTGDVMDIDGMEDVDSGQMDTEVADRTIVESGPDAEGCLESVKAAGAPCKAGDTSGMDIKMDSSPDSFKTSNHAAEKKHSSSESDIFSEKGHNKDNLDETLKGSPSSSKTVISDSFSDSSVCMKTPVKCSKPKSTPRTMTSGKDSGPSFKVKKVKAVSLPSKRTCSSKSGSQEQLVSSDSSDTSLEEDNQKKRKQSAQKRKSPKQPVIDTSSESEKDEDERTNAKDSGGHFASDYSPGSDKESDDEDKQPPETRKTKPEQVAVKSAVPLSSSDSEADDTKRSLQVTHARKPKKKFNTKHKGNGKKDSDKATRNQQKVFTSKEFISTESDSDESESIQAKKIDKIIPDVPSGHIASKSSLSELNKDRMGLVNETKPISSKRGRDISSRIFKDRNSKLSSQQGENRGTFPSLTASFVKSDTVLPGSSNETRGDTGHEEVGDIPAVPEPNAFSEGEKTSKAKGESSRPSPMAPKRRVRPSKHRYQPLETEKDFVDIILERRRVTRSASDKSGSEAKQSEDSEPPEIVRKAEAQRKTDLVVEKLKSAHEKKKFVTNLEKSRLNVLKRKSGTESGNSSDDVKRKGQTALAGPEVSSASEMEGVCSVGKSESVTDSDMDTIQVLVYQENLQSSASESVFSSPVMCQDNLQSSASDSVFSSPVRSVKSLDLTQDKGCDGSTKSPLKSVAGVTTVVEKVNKDKLSVKPVSAKHDSAKTIHVRPESVPTESVISNSADVTEKESNPQTNSIQSTSGTEPVITQPLPTTPDSSRGTGSDIAGAVPALPAPTPTPMNSSRAEATEDENTLKGSICGSESSHIDEPETSVPSETGLLPAPGSGTTRTQEETQGSSSSVDMPSKDQNCRENRDLKVNENVHKVVGKVQEGEQASSSLTGGMLTSPSLEMNVGKCPRRKRLLRTGVASKTEDETNTVVKDVTSKDKCVAEDVTAKDVAEDVTGKDVAKGVAEDVTAKDVSDKGVAEDVTGKDVAKGVAEDVTAKDVSDKGVAEDVTGKDVAKGVAEDVTGKDVAKDVSDMGVAEDVTSLDKGVAKDVTSDVSGKDVAKDVMSKDKGVDKDVTSDVSGKDVAKDVTSDVTGKDVAKDVMSKVKGVAKDVTSDVSGKDVAKDVTSKDKGVAEDVVSDVKDVAKVKGVAKDVTSDVTGKDVAKDVTRKEKGVVKEKTKDVSSKDKEVSGEETKDVTMDKDVTCYNKDVTIMDKDLNKDVSSKLKDVTSKDEDLSNGKDMTSNVKCLTEDKDVTKDKDMIKDKDVTKDKDITKDKNVTSTDKGQTEDKDVTKDKDMTKDKDVSSTDKGLTEDKDVTKDKDVTSTDRGPTEDKDVTSIDKGPTEDKDVTSIDKGPTEDKDVTKDKDVTSIDKGPTEDKDVTKDKDVTSTDKGLTEDKDETKDKDMTKDKDVTSIDRGPTEDKDVTSIDKGLTEDKDVTKDKGVTSEDSSRSKDSDGQGVHRKTRRKLQRVSASEEQLPQAECPAVDSLCPRTSRRTTRANQLKRANMKRQMSFDQEEAKTVDEPSTVEKKTKKVSKDLDSLRKRTKEEETEKSGDIGINATLEQDKEEEKGPKKESCNTVMKASQDEEDVNAEDSLVVKNKKFEETIKGHVEQRETSSEVGQDVEEVEHVQEVLNLKEASVVSHESVRGDVEARDGCEKTQEDECEKTLEDGKKITDTYEMSGSEEDSDDGSKRKRVESQNSFGFTVNNAETTSSTEGPSLLDTWNLIPELQELEEEDTFAEDVEEPKSIMAGPGLQTPERVASPEIVALTQGTFSSISALLRSEFSLASVSTTPLPPSPMNFLRIRDPVSPLPPSPTGSLDDPTPLAKGKSKRKTLTKSKNRAETPPTPDGTKFTKIAPLDEAVSSMSSGTQRRVARLARPQADLPKFGADLSSTTVKPKAVYSKPWTAGQGDATFFPVLRSAEISLAKQQLAKRLENKEKKEQERKTRKRKSSESEAAPQKKQVMKQETRNLQSVSRVERVLEEYLHSTDATPTSFCNTVVGKKLETDVAMEIFRAIVKMLQTSCSDQLPLVYAACSAGSDIKGPFMTDTETRLLELITALLEEYMDCPRHQLMELLWNSIFLPCVALPGRLALCRMFTALCRCEGDLEQVRVFIFKLLTCGYLSYVESVLAVVGVWPLTLMGGADMPPMIQVVRHTILEAGTAEGADSFVQKLMMCYQKICQWPPLSESPADLLSSLINRLKQSIITKQHHGCIYETMKSIELLLWKQGWKFVYMHFVNRHFNSVTDAWKAKGDNSSVDPRFLNTMIRIFGNVYHLPKFSHKHKDFLKVLKRCFISTLERPTEHFEVQLYAAEVLAELSPFHPQFIMDALAEWYKHNSVMVPAQQRTSLEQTRNALIAKMPTFFVEKFA